jgi:hypothetical protein
LSRLATSFVLGYHGCDKEIADKAISGNIELTPSDTNYDWLGPGIYFWESDPQRALEWAQENKRRIGIKKPAVIGAVIDLRNCLDLVSRENVELVADAYESFVKIREEAGLSLPENKGAEGKSDEDRLLRFLDNAVIKHLHQMIAGSVGKQNLEAFDTVRGMFTEGDRAYPGAGYFKKSHVQIAVINPACILGYFHPRLIVN